LAPEAIAERLESIRRRVRRAAEAAGRDASSIAVLAVTKGQPVGAVHAAMSLGLRDVGESRVQEAQAKRSAFGDELSWHMVGHLQRNKARAAASLFDVVHSLDSMALASALARHRDASSRPLRAYIEVELTGIAGRSGVPPEAVGALLEEVCTLPQLEVMGLMTIAPPGAAGVAAACFASLRELRDTLADRHGAPLGGLSMGMSDDFEIAISHGATIIRLGRVLFGDHPGSGT
jgi:pyridoxal phosphate enzyme (YggS family)